MNAASVRLASHVTSSCAAVMMLQAGLQSLERCAHGLACSAMQHVEHL